MGSIVFIIFGLLFCLYGAGYFLHAQTTNSAIHEIAAGVGIGIGLLMFGVAWMLGTLGGIRDRLANVEDLAEAAATDEFVRDVRLNQGPALTFLNSLSRAGGAVAEKHQDAALEFVKKRRGLTSLTRRGRDGVVALFAQSTASEAGLRDTLNKVREMGDDEVTALREAADRIIKATKGASPSQQRLYELAFG